jgi:hypothetical protein
LFLEAVWRLRFVIQRAWRNFLGLGIEERFLSSPARLLAGRFGMTTLYTSGILNARLDQAWRAALLEIPDGCHQCVDFFAGVVQRERGAHAVLYTKSAQNRLRAMMS